MTKLDATTIETMAHKFAVLLTDETRQPIIDQLGFHPVNHARFAHCLAQYHPNNWQVYLDLTAWIK
jgi:hypothetical protein